MYKFLTKYNVLYEYQFGFRKGYSTNLALIDVIEKIKAAIDNNKFVCGVFLDLTKAFDTVDHDILLHKLSHYGIRGVSNRLIRSYLSNRKQYVKIKDSQSEKLSVSCGVPQGSVLGPLLFLIYVNDIAMSAPEGNIKLFADDTNAFIEHENINQLLENAQVLLKYLFKWFRDNRLTVNACKSSFTIFTTKFKRSYNHIPNTIRVNKLKFT